MQKFVSTIVVALFLLMQVTYAADSATGGTAASTGSSTTAVTAGDTPGTNNSVGATMNSAPTIKRSMGSSLGEYASVSCSSNALFESNSCDQCFEGGSAKVGDSLTGLFDNWTNTTESTFVAYKSEQKTPNMVKIGNTSWISTPADETKMWKSPSDVVWSPLWSGANKDGFILPKNQKVRFVEADIGAKYTLEKTDKKNGDTVGILRFPVVSHVIDASGNEGAADTHYECVSYKLSASSSPSTPVPTTPTPEKMTETKTGPETLILIIAAFFIAFGLMFSLRRRM